MPKKLKNCIFLVFILSMFFSSVPLAWAGTVDAAGLKQMFDKYGAPSRWSSLKSAVDSPTLAWSETYIMRSYLVMYQATKDKQYINNFIDHADSALARRDSVRGVIDYRGLSLPVWRDGKYTDYKTYYIYADETGLIATPLAQFAALVNKDPNLASYRAKANEYVKAAKDAVNVLFMSQLRNSDVNFTWIEDGNTLHLDRPINKNLAVGSALLAIYEATGDSSYLDKGKKMANFFKQNLLTNSSSGGYYWKYYPSDPRFTNTIEDTNHANVALQFINMAYDNGIFSAADMRKFANTAAKVLVKSDGTIANYLNGSGTIEQQGQIGNWLVFAPWSPSLFDAAYNVIKNKSSLNPPEIQGLAYMNYVLAQNEETDQPPGEVPDPDPNPTPEPGAGDNLINNGDFGAGSTGWVNINNAAQIKTESNGNKYLTNSYNFYFYQDLQLKPGTYQINARTRKGTAVKGARVVVRFYYQDGSDNFKTFTYVNKGSGWEDMPGMTLSVPATAVTTRIYLSGMPGDNGTQDFDDLTLVAAGDTSAPDDTTPPAESDTEAPAVSISAPASGSSVTAATALKATAGDNEGVVKLTFAYATNPQGSWTTIGDATLSSGSVAQGVWNLTWNVAGLANATYYVRAMAVDAAGNNATSDPVAIQINNVTNLINNGDFGAGSTGWVNINNTAQIKTESNGNKYLTNTYNFYFYQDLQLKPGTYQINARTRKGTAVKGARVVVRFYYQDGSDNFKTFTYINKDSGWEDMPGMTLAVPATAVTTRIYLSGMPGDNGTQDFDDLVITQLK